MRRPMIEQHEEERRRLSRELHDETGQVFSAVRIELGVIALSLGALADAELQPVLADLRTRLPVPDQ